jgi:ATP-dependent Clp protease protease subunit
MMRNSGSQGVEAAEPDEASITTSDKLETFFLDRRKILLIGEVCEQAAIFVNMHLQFFASSKDMVTMYISSPGGDVQSGYGIIDQMQMSPFPIRTVVRGHAHSMAAIIAAHGARGQRYTMPHASMMVHSIAMEQGMAPIAEAQGVTEHFAAQYARSLKELAKVTKMSHKGLVEFMKKTQWMDAAKAIKLGFVDGFWTKKLEIASNR